MAVRVGVAPDGFDGDVGDVREADGDGGVDRVGVEVSTMAQEGMDPRAMGVLQQLLGGGGAPGGPAGPPPEGMPGGQGADELSPDEEEHVRQALDMSGWRLRSRR